MEEQLREVHVGDIVIFHDTKGIARNSLVTEVHGYDCLNIVYVSGDTNRQDGHGRQIERDSSVVHKCQTSVHGNYWRFKDEEPIPYKVPLET